MSEKNTELKAATSKAELLTEEKIAELKAAHGALAVVECYGKDDRTYTVVLKEADRRTYSQMMSLNAQLKIVDVSELAIRNLAIAEVSDMEVLEDHVALGGAFASVVELSNSKPSVLKKL